MDLIHEMGGLTYLPHPLDRNRSHYTPDRVVELAPRVDIIEVYNPWCEPPANRAAANLASGEGLRCGPVAPFCSSPSPC